MSKFSAEVPKGDGWGVEDVIADAVKRILSGEKSPIIPVIGMIDVKRLDIDPETHNVIAVVRVRRLESLTSTERIRAAQRMLMQQWVERKGVEGEAILPFEEKELFERAFAGIDEETLAREIQDEKEAARDEEMTEEDRLRAHVVAMHDVDPSDSAVVDWPANRLAQEHQHWHDSDITGPRHHEDDLRWRRVEVAELLAENEEPTDELSENDQDDPGWTQPPLFDDGQGKP